ISGACSSSYGASTVATSAPKRNQDSRGRYDRHLSSRIHAASRTIIIGGKSPIPTGSCRRSSLTGFHGGSEVPDERPPPPSLTQTKGGTAHSLGPCQGRS